MKLSDLIPKKWSNNKNWIVGDYYLFYKRYVNLPIAYIDNDDNCVYIFFDIRLKKEVIRIVEHLISERVEFYFMTPEFSNPSGVIDLNYKNIKHYLKSYANQYFYDSFHKMNFDLIKNMVDWTDKNNCYDLIKECYDLVYSKISKGSYDYYSNKTVFEYPEYIRSDYRTLYRDIQISKIL
jgi:hypothetical protein